ncbi:MAG: methyltransferase domain-containing protein [Chloroherpetonaceae bacterium]|nr:methyltransferase domain-containing protein [Chthonomonadaceae bacterium]MDW8208453.1 methyltransferase domain-containing protein [Chloroherpetonaceae bacterium]
MTIASPARSELSAGQIAVASVLLFPGGVAREIPTVNFQGLNLPARHMGLLAQVLGLPDQTRILELTGDDFLLPDDRVVRGPDRTHARFDARAFFAGQTGQLPFEAGEFDFVVCCGGIERTPDPVAACQELQRIGTAGLIETPGPVAALLGAHPAMRWVVSVERASGAHPLLTFRPRPFRRAPLRYALRSRLYADSRFRFAWEWEYRNVVHTQFLWNGDIPVQVLPRADNAFDYDDPAQAAESHLDSAINAIRFGNVPYPLILADANEAVRLRPQWAQAHNVRGCALWLSGKRPAAIEAFRKACHLEPDNPDYQHNARLAPGSSTGPRLTLLPPEREDIEDIETNFGGKVFYAFVNYDERLARDMRIQPGERVLDVGSGQRPLKRADVCVDIDVREGLHRQGQAISREKPLVCGNVERLPFATRAFDVACCRMVLEHVQDPAAACRELQRVARRGFLETPNTLWECFYGHPTHRWLVEWEAQTRTLVFRRKPFDAIPFQSAIVPLLYTQADIQRAFEVTFRNLTTTQIEWDEEHPFAVRVEDSPDAPYDYLNRPEDAIRGSLNYARDLLENGLAPVAIAECEDAIRHAETWQAENRQLRHALLREALTLRVQIARAMGDTVGLQKATEHLVTLDAATEPARIPETTNGSLHVRQQARIAWHAPLRDPSGYADEARHFLFALEQAGVPVAAREIRWSAKIAVLPATRERILRQMMDTPAAPDAIHVCHILASHFQRVPGARASIGRTMFETDRLPPGWAEACNRMDAVWVPGEFNRQSFLFAGVRPEKLRVVPGAIDLAPYRPDCAPLQIAGLRGFTFLSLFDWTLRKGWDLLLRAFLEEFRPSEDVSLLIKTHSSMGYSTAQIAEMIGDFISRSLGYDLNRIPDIVLQDTNIPDALMPNLYRTAQCYVMPSRGEGWGRPYMEAMAMGLPVIATNWSGQTAFITPETGFLIDYSLVDVPEAAWRETPTYQGHRWAEPSVPHLRALMRQVFEDRKTAQEVGQRARAHIERHFTYAAVAQILLAELERFLS